MGFFSFLFGGGKYPTTSKYEAQLEQQKADYARFLQIGKGADFKRYNELKALTESKDFQSRVDHLKNDKFSDTEEYKKEQELKSILKSSEYKKYDKYVSSGKAKSDEAAINSANYKEYASLEKQVESPQFTSKLQETERARKEAIKAKKEADKARKKAEKAKKKAEKEGKDIKIEFPKEVEIPKESIEEKTLARFKELKKSSEVKTAVKALSSSAYENYKKVSASPMLKRKDELEKYVKSDAFLKVKNDLENKNRFKESKECKDLEEFASLSKSADIVWYNDKVAKNTFAEYGKWSLAFEDNFAGTKLDSKKWTVGYYVGKKFSNIIYSLADERQKFTEENAKVAEGALTIQTRPAKVKGDVWDPASFGFVKRDLESTASLINTGDSFRQKFGRFDFKVQTSGAKAPVTNNIWLRSDDNEEINVASFGIEPKTIALGSVSGNKKNMGSVNDVKFENSAYIYSLVWTADKLSWLVNGVEVFSSKNNVPKNPMYIGISSNVIGEGDINNADLKVDWIRVYSQAAAK